VGWRNGATPAMRILHLRMVSATTGGRLSWAQAVLRYAGYWWSLATVGCGFLAALFDRRRRGLADRVAGSLVLTAHPVPLTWVAGIQGWTLRPSRPPRSLPLEPTARPDAEPPVVKSAWTWTDVVPVLVLFFPVAFGASWVVVVSAKGLGVTGAGLPAVSVLENLAAYGASLLLIALLVRWRRHMRLSSLGLRLPNWRWLLAGIPMAFAAFVLEDGGGLVGRVIFPTAAASNQCVGIRGSFGASLALALVSVAVIAPVSEEVIFRGFTFRYLHGRLPLWSSVLVSAVIFSAAHAGWQEPTLFLPVFTTGVLLAYMYAKSGSIWPGVIVHMTLNIVATIAIFAAASC
jgi:membrane protease YdiL (CAAX protease family)